MAKIGDDKLRAMLDQCPRAQLTDWLLVRGSEDGRLRRSLVALLAPQAETATLVSELLETISGVLSRVRRSRDAWKLARPITAELEGVLQTLDKMIDTGNASAAEKVLKRLVSAAGELLDRVDDSSGDLGLVSREAVAVWGRAWARMTPRDPRQVAKLVFDGVTGNAYGIQDDMIADFAEAMGPEGLAALKEMMTAAHESNRHRTDLDHWRRDAPLRHLANLADAMGDVDLYIHVQHACGLTDVYSLSIARRLHDASRFEEALAFIDRADPKQPPTRGETDDHATLKSKILASLGRHAESRATLWEAFCTALTVSKLDRVLEATPPTQRETCVADAITVAQTHPNRVNAASFLVDRGEQALAARLVETHPDAFNGRPYEQLLRLAQALEKNHPAAAWRLYRALLLDILDSKRAAAYHHATDHYHRTAALGARAEIKESHDALGVDLRQRHGRKHAFWKHVDMSPP